MYDGFEEVPVQWKAEMFVYLSKHEMLKYAPTKPAANSS